LEIRAIRKRYFQLIEEERLEEAKSLKANNENLERKIAFLESERDRLRKELDGIRKHAQEERRQFYDTLNVERTQFNKEIDEERKEKYTLLRQVGYMEGVFEGIRKSLVDRGDERIHPEHMLNLLDSLVPENIE
jgi:hypothetical protein